MPQRALKQIADIQRNAHVASSLCCVTAQSELGMCDLRSVADTCFAAFCGSPNHPVFVQKLFYYLSALFLYIIIL